MRALLIPWLVLAATPVWADWVKVAATADASLYVDPSAIARQGGIRRVPVVHDYATPEGSVHSRRVTYEIDCAGERMRSVSVVEYAQPMARGEPVAAREGDSTWLYVAPRTGSNVPSGTPYRAIHKFVCSQ